MPQQPLPIASIKLINKVIASKHIKRIILFLQIFENSAFMGLALFQYLRLFSFHTSRIALICQPLFLHAGEEALEPERQARQEAE